MAPKVDFKTHLTSKSKQFIFVPLCAKVVILRNSLKRFIAHHIYKLSVCHHRHINTRKTKEHKASSTIGN